jgi:hypothetical protein
MPFFSSKLKWWGEVERVMSVKGGLEDNPVEPVAVVEPCDVELVEPRV